MGEGGVKLFCYTQPRYVICLLLLTQFVEAFFLKTKQALHALEFHMSTDKKISSICNDSVHCSYDMSWQTVQTHIRLLRSSLFVAVFAYFHGF